MVCIGGVELESEALGGMREYYIGFKGKEIFIKSYFLIFDRVNVLFVWEVIVFSRNPTKVFLF